MHVTAPLFVFVSFLQNLSNSLKKKNSPHMNEIKYGAAHTLHSGVVKQILWFVFTTVPCSALSWIDIKKGVKQAFPR